MILAKFFKKRKRKKEKDRIQKLALWLRKQIAQNTESPGFLLVMSTTIIPAIFHAIVILIDESIQGTTNQSTSSPYLL